MWHIYGAWVHFMLYVLYNYSREEETTMDQVKIGKFIASCRKEKNMTQRQVADVLEISDKTISKWECGKGLPEVIRWFASFVPVSIFLGFGWDKLGNEQILSKIVIIIAMTFVDVLFTIIYKGEYVYWITYGPDFETARNAVSERRKAYAWKYLRIFLAASVILVLYLFGSTLFDLSASLDIIVFLVVIIAAALSTVPIKF